MTRLEQLLCLEPHRRPWVRSCAPDARRPPVHLSSRSVAVGSGSRRWLTVSALVLALLLAGVSTVMPANTGIAAAETSLTPVIRDCGDHYLVTRYNADGTTLGAWRKQLSAQGTIFTAGETWTLTAGGDGEPDRFVSGSGKVQQVVPCDEPQPNTLVSNTGQPGIAGASLIRDHAQAFTTGSHASGYRLTRVGLKMRTAGSQISYSVSVYEDSSGAPGNHLGTLGSAGSLQAAWTLMHFTAPSGGIDLAAGTTYWVLVDTTSQGNANTEVELQVTSSDAEDSGASAGWSIGDVRRTRLPGSVVWPGSDATDVLKMVLQGHVVTSSFPGAVQTSTGAVPAGIFPVAPLAGAQFLCGNTPRPRLTIDELVMSLAYYCDPMTRQWQQRQLAIPGVDYASDAQIEAAKNSPGARACREKGFNTWDPITERCLTRAPWYQACENP